jgi:DNA invertase Pin-like site-specific DNA recombinase
MAFQDQLPVAGYFRVSKARDDMHAPAVYQEEINRYCAYKELILHETFADIDYSGWKRSRMRPALQELVTRRKEFSAVIVPKLARFGRSLTHLMELFETFEKDGVALIFLDLGLDTSTSQGRLLRNIMASFAEYESDVKSDYARSNFEHVVREGRPYGGRRAFGYNYDKTIKNYVIEPEEAALIRRVYDEFLGGETLNGLANAFNAAGLTTLRGCRWRRVTIGTILKNPIYCGHRWFDGELVEATWQPIVTKAQWEEVRAIRSGDVEARPWLMATRSKTYLLSGLVTCGVCGRHLHHRPLSGRDFGEFGCSGSEAFGSKDRCAGGSITDRHVERLVVQALKNRYWMTFGKRSDRARDMEKRWESASLEERRDMLRLTIESIELVPRSARNARGKGEPRGRKIRIRWVDSWSGVTDLQDVEVRPVDEPARKSCFTCGEVKPSTEFGLRGTERYGVCLACKRKGGSQASAKQTWAQWRRERVRQKPGG